MVYRIYVEKKPEFAIEASGLKEELVSLLGVRGLRTLRIVNCYDVEGISRALFDQCVPTVFSEPPVDLVHETLPQGDFVFAVEYLPGQFDQRADSAAECIQLISQGERPLVRSANVYLLSGDISAAQRDAIQAYVINPVEARIADLTEKETLKTEYPIPTTVETLDGFVGLPQAEHAAFVQHYGLAMDTDDLAFCQSYFQREQRNPTITELRMIDTYWSDHCRHTTFLTTIDRVDIADPAVEQSYTLYRKLRGDLGRADKPITLMDIATMGARALKAKGMLPRLDESEEINACTVKINVDNDGKTEDWLLLFKNETHNHPTEIEPFGGAATCLGGAIRDPLSGRAYVYQAMRVTGAGDPLVPVGDTLPGKLPQRKLVTTAAAGYASYGNQIGLATGQVKEIYHPGYVAKRMEIGAVIGAAPAANVIREVPEPGDIVLLLGGKTGRDGCGGATGSSKAHKMESLEHCGAEVQKGNPPIERKLQRLFRNPAATRLIRRCNDFGAGGVSVAIGELADGLHIHLDAIPKKYDGLDGTELAISESQERMAVVVRENDAARFIALAAEENLEATPVAEVTEAPRLVMDWRGNTIVDLSRDFLNSNGAEKHAAISVASQPAPVFPLPAGKTFAEKMTALLSDLNHCSQKGLSERFDSTIGAATVTMPFGGKNQLTPTQTMSAKLPVPGETTTCSGMAYGFDPFVSEQNQYDGAYLAVVESIAKLAAAGYARGDMYLTFQEYFERLHNDPKRWGKPLAGLLGALQAQLDLGVASIGGKDSMSGSFEQLDVPPTLVSFAVATGHTSHIISPEFKQAGSRVALLQPQYRGLLPEPQSFIALLDQMRQLILEHKIRAAYTPARGGIAEALFLMGVGNNIGFALADSIDPDSLFAPLFGAFVVELADGVALGETLGYTTAQYTVAVGKETVDLIPVQEAWESKLESVLPYRHPTSKEPVSAVSDSVPPTFYQAPKISAAKPKVLIPVFPGTNCEYDTARAFRRAGAEPVVYVIRNLSPADVAQSAADIAKLIDQSQIVMLPGGFSGGDEPEGSAKLINAFFRGPLVAEAIARLLEQRDGLMLGICNGFQALVKLGLLPFGKITDLSADSPTLTFNTIGRHQSMLVHTRIASNRSPWLMHEPVGAIHTIAVSHGEGRFVATDAALETLLQNGQIATQYVDLDGVPTMDVRYNPNGSALAIEGITSPNGRVFGKMGHTERSGDGLYQNVPGNAYQKLFEGGVDYYSL